MRTKFVIPLLLILCVLVGTQTVAQEQPSPKAKQQLLVRVDGLSCPFCAYGLEKKLSKIPGVISIEISVEQGEALLTVDGEAAVSEKEVREAVTKAGFTPREITFVDHERK